MLWWLLHRSILVLHGVETLPFLQGLLTQDVFKLGKDYLLYSLILSPKGRFYTDVFFFEKDGAVYLDVYAPQKDEIIKKLNLYKLRRDVKIEDCPQAGVWASLNKENFPRDAILFEDPRHNKMGWRGYDLEGNGGGNIAPDLKTYDEMRLTLGIPDGPRDMIPDKSIPLEWRMDELGAIDWQKGCYLGQELTARTKYTGVVRKTLITLEKGDGGEFTPGPLKVNGEEVGEIIRTYGPHCFALMSLEFLGQGQEEIDLEDCRVKIRRY
jgi:folate-binding protein YgfZ